MWGVSRKEPQPQLSSSGSPSPRGSQFPKSGDLGVRGSGGLGVRGSRVQGPGSMSPGFKVQGSRGHGTLGPPALPEPPPQSDRAVQLGDRPRLSVTARQPSAPATISCPERSVLTQTQSSARQTAAVADAPTAPSQTKFLSSATVTELIQFSQTKLGSTERSNQSAKKRTSQLLWVLLLRGSPGHGSDGAWPQFKSAVIQSESARTLHLPVCVTPLLPRLGSPNLGQDKREGQQDRSGEGTALISKCYNYPAVDRSVGT